MFLIDNKRFANQCIQQLRNGLSAYTDSKEMAILIKKGIKDLDIPIYEDVTDKGSWFIPMNDD